MPFQKIRKGYYLTKNNKIVEVIVLWDGVTRSGKYMAKVTLWGKSEEEAFWVPANRFSWYPSVLEKVRQELQDNIHVGNREESMKKENS